MADVPTLIATILSDAQLIADLYAKISNNVAAAKDVLATDPNADMAQQLAAAQAKLKAIQATAAMADADFDAALAASQA